jgi:hypothetical protein
MTDAIGHGDVVIDLPNRLAMTWVTLKDTFHAPQMVTMLISISRLNAKFQTTFAKGMCAIALQPQPRSVS